ncbi:MAG: hypothetical protein OHK0039_39650 [Bacteroidia bacterium]
MLVSVSWLSWAGVVLGQDSIPQGVQVVYQRQNNFSYGGQLQLGYTWESGRYSLELSFLHDNLLNTQRTDNPFVQLNVRAQLWQHYRLTPQWSLSSWIETDQFWTVRNQRYQLYLGATYRPLPGITVRPLIGYSWDYRSGILDQGITPALVAQGRYDFGDGLTMETNFWGRVKYIYPRHQRNLLFRSTWTKLFEEQAGLSLAVQGGSNQMDDYQAGSIQRIKSDTVGATLALQYRLLPGLYWESVNEALFTRRRLDYDTYAAPQPEFNDLRFAQTQLLTRQQLSFRLPRLSGTFAYGYEFLGRGYELSNSLELPEAAFVRLRTREQQKDYYRRQTSLDLQLAYRIHPRHRISLVGTNRYLQYDTPAEDNYDDHDELNYGLTLEWRATWSRRFSTGYRLLGSVRRYAFLFGERSQDNYTQRNLRLEFDYRWQVLPRLSVRGEQLIYVNYNVKDFEDRNRTDRSTRNLETRLVVQASPRKHWNMELTLYRRELHVSYLNWAAFAETPLDTTINYSGEWHNRLALRRQTRAAAWQLDLGWQHLSQLRYQNTSMISLENILTPINLHIRNHQTGPLTGLLYRHLRRGSIEASVWWQMQIQDYTYAELARFSTLSASFREDVLQQTELTFRPFLKLQVNYLLQAR